MPSSISPRRPPRTARAADGALYWKAYALKKAGKNHRSRWPRSRSCASPTPAAAGWTMPRPWNCELGKPGLARKPKIDEEMKLLALNGIMQSDPERAIPLVENHSQSLPPRRSVKKNALFVLAQSSNPQGAGGHRTDRPRRRQSRSPGEGDQLHQRAAPRQRRPAAPKSTRATKISR